VKFVKTRCNCRWSDHSPDCKLSFGHFWWSVWQTGNAHTGLCVDVTYETRFQRLQYKLHCDHCWRQKYYYYYYRNRTQSTNIKDRERERERQVYVRQLLSEPAVTLSYAQILLSILLPVHLLFGTHFRLTVDPPHHLAVLAANSGRFYLPKRMHLSSHCRHVPPITSHVVIRFTSHICISNIFCKYCTVAIVS